MLTSRLGVILVLALGSTHCGGSVSASDPPGPPADSGTPPSDGGTTPPGPPVEWKESASCADVTATCTGATAIVVRGHASGLGDLEGARAEFAVRHALTESGSGFDHEVGVALGRTLVKNGAFETCVCVPQGANMYPQIAAVVYRPGTTTMTGRDVARATFSQRYATLGEEDVTYACTAVPSDLQKEAAVAALSARTADVTLEKLTTYDGKKLYAGLVAQERPLAAQVIAGEIAASKVDIRWSMPGQAYASERVAFFIDKNDNGLCDADGSDIGAFAPYASSIVPSGPWLQGADLAAVCDALRPGASRE